ncbi:MAG TPA: hypothetical protein VHC95_09765 [Opitutales bacterium]|nr:hypothetical protein [Opitutales bacterium]
MKIAFQSSGVSLRGTEVATFDYAWFARKLLGVEVIALLRQVENIEQNPVFQKFSAAFPTFPHSTAAEREAILREQGVDLLYVTKAGAADDAVSQAVPTGVHAVFLENAFHGDIYAYISSWLSQVMTYGQVAWVPYMVNLPEPGGDLRGELGIPADAVVFGRYGGAETFDIDFVQKLVVELAQKNPRLHFLLMNTDRFGPPLPNVRFLPGTADLARKAKFIATCDAMLHARYCGETFGLAVAEFSCLNKPIFTFEHSPDRHHLEALGARAFRYRDAAELRKQILGFSPDPGGDWRVFAELCRPENVMQKFRTAFIEPLG